MESRGKTDALAGQPKAAATSPTDKPFRAAGPPWGLLRFWRRALFSRVGDSGGQVGNAAGACEQVGVGGKQGLDGVEFGSQLGTLWPLLFVLGSRAPRWPGALPVVEDGMPAGEQRANCGVEHGDSEVAEVVLAVAFGHGDARSVAAQDVSGGGEEGVEAAERFVEQALTLWAVGRPKSW